MTLSYNITKYPFQLELEKYWKSIREEYNSISEDMSPWHEDEVNVKDSWDTYTIYNWPHGIPIYSSVKKVPFTSDLIKQHIPTHKGVSFSRLKAGCNIPPHKGLKGNFLRCHLGIDIPDGDIGIKVEDEILRWDNGKSFVFNDRDVHTAWNNTKSDRIVLIVDFVP